MNIHLINERKTINAMVHIYCHHQHINTKKQLISNERFNELCHDCSTFLTYSHERLEKCPNSASKPNCKTCTIHCYNNEMQNYARKVMRHSGKHMLYKQPVLTIRYLLNRTNVTSSRKRFQGK